MIIMEIIYWKFRSVRILTRLGSLQSYVQANLNVSNQRQRMLEQGLFNQVTSLPKEEAAHNNAARREPKTWLSKQWAARAVSPEKIIKVRPYWIYYKRKKINRDQRKFHLSRPRILRLRTVVLGSSTRTKHRVPSSRQKRLIWILTMWQQILPELVKKGSWGPPQSVQNILKIQIIIWKAFLTIAKPMAKMMAVEETIVITIQL